MSQYLERDDYELHFSRHILQIDYSLWSPHITSHELSITFTGRFPMSCGNANAEPYVAMT